MSALKDTPHPQIGDDMASQRAEITLDLDRCNVMSINEAMSGEEGVENGVCVLALHWRPKAVKP